MVRKSRKQFNRFKSSLNMEKSPLQAATSLLEKTLAQYNVVGQCHEYKGVRRRDGYGYVTIRVPGDEGIVKKTSTTCHRAALLLKMLKEEQVTTLQINKKLECSHLCHNKCCINVEHLTLESKRINSSRKVCARRRTCQGHDPPCL